MKVKVESKKYKEIKEVEIKRLAEKYKKFTDIHAIRNLVNMKIKDLETFKELIENVIKLKKKLEIANFCYNYELNF